MNTAIYEINADENRTFPVIHGIDAIRNRMFTMIHGIDGLSESMSSMDDLERDLPEGIHGCDEAFCDPDDHPSMKSEPIGTGRAPAPPMRSWILMSLLCVLGCASTAPDERVITCTAGPDCDAKWSAAMDWLQANSSWNVRTRTDTMVATEGPDGTAKPAFEVTKVAQDDGTTRISMRAWCDTVNCDDLVRRLHRSFNDTVIAAR